MGGRPRLRCLPQGLSHCPHIEQVALLMEAKRVPGFLMLITQFSPSFSGTQYLLQRMSNYSGSILMPVPATRATKQNGPLKFETFSSRRFRRGCNRNGAESEAGLPARMLSIIFSPFGHASKPSFRVPVLNCTS